MQVYVIYLLIELINIIYINTTIDVYEIALSVGSFFLPLDISTYSRYDKFINQRSYPGFIFSPLDISIH